jgi:hypothetical protein
VEIDATRWTVGWPFFGVGTAAVVAGGLVGAASATAPSEHASWAAAYLVLVVGVAQIALGAGQAALSARAPSVRTVRIEAIGWNLANAAVIAGTLANVPALVYAGGALLAIVLAGFVLVARDARPVFGGRRWPAYVFRAIVVVLLISIPVGLVLATVRGTG